MNRDEAAERALRAIKRPAVDRMAERDTLRWRCVRWKRRDECCSHRGNTRRVPERPLTRLEAWREVCGLCTGRTRSRLRWYELLNDSRERAVERSAIYRKL